MMGLSRTGHRSVLVRRARGLYLSLIAPLTVVCTQPAALADIVRTARPDTPPGLYSIAGTDLVWYPTTGGDGSVVGQFDFEVPGLKSASDFSTAGMLYAIGGSVDPDRYTLYSLDPVSGVVIEVGDTGFPNTRGLAIGSQDQAYALQSSYANTLYTVDLSDASATAVATGVTLDGAGIIGLTFNASDELFGIVGASWRSPKIVQIDTVTGDVIERVELTDFGRFRWLVAIAFNEYDDLFGLGLDPTNGYIDRLCRFDLDTGDWEIVGKFLYDAGQNLAHYVPEPVSAACLFFGALVARRR